MSVYRQAIFPNDPAHPTPAMCRRVVEASSDRKRLIAGPKFEFYNSDKFTGGAVNAAVFWRQWYFA